MYLVYIISVLLLAFFLGFLCSDAKYKESETKVDGYFRINHQDPTKDLVTLELTVDLDQIEEDGYLLLEVVNE